jgi:predicted anti-sigma-YlaC factor YlaD
MSNKKDIKPKDENDDRIVKCEDIQELLLEYADRELGDSRSALVREHLLYCDNCKASFEEIMSTITALENAATPDEELPSELSEKHYARVIRALTHPILDWIAVHHRMVAIITAIIVLITTIFALNNIKVVKLEKPDMGYEIYLRQPPNSVRTNGAPIIIWRSSKGMQPSE